jgi:hypothetical protein
MDGNATNAVETPRKSGFWTSALCNMRRENDSAAPKKDAIDKLSFLMSFVIAEWVRKLSQHRQSFRPFASMRPLLSD